QGVELRGVPEAVIDAFGDDGGELIAKVHEIAVERELFEHTMSRVEERHAGGFIDAAALHADETIFDHIDETHTVTAADLVERLDDLQRAELLAVPRDGEAGREGDRHRLDLVRRFLWRRGHAEFDRIDAVDVQVFELSRLVTDVQAVLVAAVRLRN